MFKFGDKVLVGTADSFFNQAKGTVVDTQQGKSGETLYRVKLDYNMDALVDGTLLTKQGDTNAS